MRFNEMNWFDIEDYLKVDNRIMVLIGSCEQHGYLSLQTDTIIPVAIADAVSKRTNVIVAPEVNFGSSPYFMAYPGTISLRISTLMDLIEDVLRSLYSYGFRKFYLLNGHGGNEPVRGRIYELANEFSDLKVYWYSWWKSHSVEAIASKHGFKAYHAGWLEAFPFTRISNLPNGEKKPPAISGLLGAEEARRLYGDGVFGGKYQVSDEIMEELFNVIVEDVIHIILNSQGG